MAALDSIIYTASNATLLPATPEAGDPVSIRAFSPPVKAHLLTAWMTPSNGTPVSLVAEIKSPRFHDAVHGIHLQQTLTGIDGLPLIPMHRSPQLLESQDTPEVDLQGTGGGPIDAILIQNYYEVLNGSDARFIDEETLNQRGMGIANTAVSVVVGTGTGGFEGATPINSGFDILKANKDYALLGFLCDDGAGSGFNALAVSLRSSDTGQLRVATPGTFKFPEMTSRHFVRLTRAFNIPLIPVFNASNKGSMIVEVASPDGAATYTVTAIMQELS